MGALSLWSERITMESLLAETPDKLTRQKPSSSIANPNTVQIFSTGFGRCR